MLSEQYYLPNPSNSAEISAEEFVIGAALVDPTIIPKVFNILSPDDFLHSYYSDIAKVIQELYTNGEVVDIVTVLEKIQSKKNDASGYLTAMTTAMENLPNVENAVVYAKTVKKFSNKRKLYKLLNEVADGVVNNSISIEEAEAKVGEFFWQIRDREENPTLTDTLSNIIDKLGKGDEGLYTGFSIDKYISLRKGTLNILAARPGKGKTTFALNIALNIAKQGKKVLFVSLEMSQEELAKKLISIEAQVVGDKLNKKNFISEEEMGRIVEKSAIISELPLVIDDTVPHDKASVFLRIKREMLTGCDFVVVDYLQLIKGDLRSRIDNITDISASLKSLAVKLNIPILALSQLNRSVEQRDDKVPRLSDLRDSGAIEQDADTVIFLYTEDKETEKEGLLFAKVAKNRSGQTGTIKLQFLKEYSTFREWEVGDVRNK